jgi:multidrug transporter EmrE-like cation transporter
MIIAVILASMACAVGGQLSLKRGMNRAGRVSRSAGPLDWRAGTGPVVLGLSFYGFSTFLWLFALSRVELSYAYPFLSLAFVAIMIGARVGLDERLRASRIAGSAFIILGVILVGMSAS